MSSKDTKDNVLIRFDKSHKKAAKIQYLKFESRLDGVR